MEKTIYIETYGCSANQNNSEILAGILTQAGYLITNNQELADIIIINSCVVKGKTENKIKRRIQDLKQFAKNKLLVISGCMPETDAKALKKLNPGAIFLGTHHFKEIINLIRDYYGKKLDYEKQDKYLETKEEIKLSLPKMPQNKLISIHQISEGCLGCCTYCKTKLAKGQLHSYPLKQITTSIENDLKQGAKEVWITSQDNANYGLDWNNKSSISPQNISEKNSSAKLFIHTRYHNNNNNNNNNYQLPELLNKILNLKHNFKLRLGMMDPNNVVFIVDKLIEIYKNKKIYKFLHIPIQSASNKILKDMNRFYTIEQAEKIIEKFKSEIPNITISTDIIVGYPKETKEDHLKNISFLQTYKPDVFNLSKMSIHKGTGVWKQIQKGKLKPQETVGVLGIHKRAAELMDIHRKTALENKQKFLNKTLSVFVNKKISENLYEARDEYYNIVLINSKEKSLGKNIKVKIQNVGVHHMIGEMI